MCSWTAWALIRWCSSGDGRVLTKGIPCSATVKWCEWWCWCYVHLVMQQGGLHADAGKLGCMWPCCGVGSITVKVHGLPLHQQEVRVMERGLVLTKGLPHLVVTRYRRGALIGRQVARAVASSCRGLLLG